MISKMFRILVCASSFLYTFFMLCNLALFLSTQNKSKHSYELEEEKDLVVKSLWALLKNTCLLSAFFLQHSVMASDFIKDFYYKYNIEDIERSIYNASTSAVLHILISNWETISWISIWNLSTEQNCKLWIVIFFVHILGWAVIYSASIMMDISEIVGLKQVYYKISGRPPPMTMKSRELQRYFMHMRHPSFTGFLLVLWIHPLMSIDRFLLASLLTIYMVLMWNIDQDDYKYHLNAIKRKLNTKSY